MPPPLTLRVFGITLRRPNLRLRFFHRESSATMEKRQLIEAIRVVNPSATLKFLNEFDEPALRQYLEHLNDARSRNFRKAPAATRADRLVA